jgi:type I restriction enzyme S subunit
LAKIKYGLGQPPRLSDDGLPLIRATNISKGKILTKDLLLVDPDDVPYDRDPILHTNDVIVVRSGAYTGDSAIIPPEYDGSISGYDLVVRATKANPEFLAYSLLSTTLLENQIALFRMRAAQPHLNAEDLGSCYVPFPLLEEQFQIVSHLNSELGHLDEIVALITHQINLLLAYRQTLITSAVTGKIDVRGVEI